MSSSAGALTRVHSLADVERPEDLPPEIAEELARLVAEEPHRVRRWLRHMAPRAAIAAVLGGGLALVHPAFAPLPLLGLLAVAEPPWRRQVLLLLDERMKELGLSRRARLRVRARCVELVGNPPRLDPNERPSAARLLEHLAPQRDRLGGEVPPPTLTALERRRDDLRLAALGYLRQSRLVTGAGVAFGAATVAGGLRMLDVAWSPLHAGFGALFLFAGATIVAFSALGTHSNMRRAIPHMRMSTRKSLALWRRMRRAAKDVDRSMPDTKRAAMIAERLLDDDRDDR